MTATFVESRIEVVIEQEAVPTRVLSLYLV